MKLRQILPLALLSVAGCKDKKAVSHAISPIATVQADSIAKKADTLLNKFAAVPQKEVKLDSHLLDTISDTPVANQLANIALSIASSKKYKTHDCKKAVRIIVDSATGECLRGGYAYEVIPQLRRSPKFKEVKIKSYKDLRQGDILVRDMERGMGWENIPNKDLGKDLWRRAGHVGVYIGEGIDDKGRKGHIEASYNITVIPPLSTSLHVFRVVEPSKTAKKLYNYAVIASSNNMFVAREYDKAVNTIFAKSTGTRFKCDNPVDNIKQLEHDNKFKKIKFKNYDDLMPGDILLGDKSHGQGWEHLDDDLLGDDLYLKKGFKGIYAGKESDDYCKATHFFYSYKKMPMPDLLTKLYGIELHAFRAVDKPKTVIERPPVFDFKARKQTLTP